MYYKYGDFTSAIQQFTRYRLAYSLSRSINLTPPGRELVRLALRAGQSAMEQESFSSAVKFLSDIASVVSTKDAFLNNMLNALQAVLSIIFGQYRRACHALMGITNPDQPELAQVISRKHMGVYLLVCSLVS